MPATNDKYVCKTKERTSSYNLQDISSSQFSQSNDVMSYEDLLIAQYLEELKKQRNNKKRSKNAAKLQSPYLQKFPQGDHLPNTSSSAGKRPISASVAGRNGAREKRRIDMKYKEDPSQWESKSVEGSEQKRRSRPTSAPVSQNRRRPMSAKSSMSVMSQRSSRSFKSLYKQQPSVIKALAYKNGSRHEAVTVTAPTMKLFLEACTLKLGLLTAARKVYLPDGSEVKDGKMIARDAEVYISCGEPFKDPYASVTGDVHRKIHAAWTVNGVVIPPEDRKKKTKATLSKRMRKMLASNARRVIVFRNGDGVEPVEALATPDKFEKFLDVCTMRLGMNSPAKVIYSWDGKVIEDINNINQLDKCLQMSATPAYGPVWISKGEGFSPKGSKDYLRNSVLYCEQQIKNAKKYKEQLQFAIDEEDEKVTAVLVLSLSEEERHESMNEANQGIQDFSCTKDMLKKNLKQISELVQDEEIEGYSYTMKHIKTLDSTHRLVGMHGIRLKVYENGFSDKEETIFFNIKEAYKGCSGNHQRVMQRLLDHITHCVRPEQNVSALSSVATKLFDENGQEIKDVSSLQNDQGVWISYGENFRDPNIYCLQLTLDKASGYCLYGSRNVAMREPILADELPPGKEKSSNWEASIGFPVLYDIEHIDEDTDPMKRDRVMTALKSQEIDTRDHFLQDKDSLQVVLYPDLIVSLKRKVGDKDIWPPKSQVWVISKKGVIYCRAMSSVALTLGERCRIDKMFPDGETAAQGYAITLDKRSTDNPTQQWGFSPEGFIYSLTQPELVLTYIPKPANANNDELQFGGDTVNIQDFENHPEQQPSGEDGTGENDKGFPGHNFMVAAIGKLPTKHPWAKAQRWALKQERIDNLGQWKHSTVQNPLWNKLAYSWPVTEEGTWNEEFDWPMEAFLIPFAPPIKVRKSDKGDKKGGHGTVALRLRVLKNGEKDENKASYVVGPDLSNMMRDLNRTGVNGKRPHRRSKSYDRPAAAQNGDAEDERVEDNKLNHLEFQLFLDRCTSLLNLSSATRRLFDSSGKEYKNLVGIERDQLVYVSCGEPWNDPNQSAQDQQRRMLLATLSADIEQMQEFLSLRDTIDYVLEKDHDSQRLVINKCCMTEEEKEKMVQGPSPEPSDGSEEEKDEEDPHSKMSYHQRAHANSDQRLEGLKWPWERVLNASLDEVTEANHEIYETDSLAKSKSKKRAISPRYKKKSASSAYKQRFTFRDGFVMLKSSPYLVIGISQPELEEKSEVVLCRKADDDPSLRWEITEDGFIQSKINSDLVLAVSMPSFTGAAIEGVYCGQAVVVQHKQDIENGRANQKWLFEKETGFIYAFYAEPLDREILAANKAGVCTNAVVAENPIQQNGYDLVQSKVDGDVKVCVACARAMRGNYKLKKQEHTNPFICAVGLAPKMGLKLIGSFQCLSGKVDLSTFEAENTVIQYEKELRRLKQMTSARLIAREISAYQPIQSVRMLAYKNGEGRSMDPVVIIASTIRGILDQCTYQLQLNVAARRLYSQDGTLLLSIPDMIKCNLVQQGLENLDISGNQDRNRRSSNSKKSSADTKVAMAMRRPIEVWVSCGEPFVSPGCFDHRRSLQMQQREERAQVSLELDKEKHILRQMQGRRTAHLDGPDFKGTMSPEHPVALEGGWTQPSSTEIKKSVQVHQLENHLTEMKAQQRVKQTTKPIVNPNKMLYKQPNVKRVLVYRNGEYPEKATYVWGNSMGNLLQESTGRLSMHMPAKRVFTASGQQIECFEDIQRDQVVCVSAGEAFKNNKAGSRQQIEIKATWSRTRKREGIEATDITVTSTRHPAVEVDPFGPPSLALPLHSAISNQPHNP
ncbi:doublecortin domain-containing protein 1-like [Anneissia japonica]|uniref:doublecortin domain-containing protein 1-like n=1 Tax=Anneissia japonica TaxID=1529436 RepID=UPI00142574A9|nr:doublecortin domain-containing protein 1-like [Anneissia japonica]